MKASESKNIIVRRSALTVKTYVRWMKRYYDYALIFVVLCVIALAAYTYYVEPKHERQSMFMMKYIDANVFTNKRFGSDPFEIKPFATGLQLDNGIQLVKSQTFCQRIVRNLALNVKCEKIGAFNKHTDLYGNEPVDIIPFGLDTLEAVLKVEISDDATQIAVRRLTVGKEENPKLEGKTYAIAAKNGKDYPVNKIGPLEVMATRFAKDYAGCTIKLTVEPLNDVAERVSRGLNVVQTAQFTDVLKCTYTDVSSHRANNILNEIPIVYDQIWAEWNANDAKHFTDAVDKRLTVHTDALKTSEDELQKILENANTLSIDADYQSLVRRKAADRAQLTQIEMALDASQAVQKQIAADNAAGRQIAAATTIIGSSALEHAITNYNALIIKRENLRQNAGENNAAYRNADAQVQASLPGIKASVANHIATLKIQHRELTKRIAAAESEIKRLATAQMQMTSNLRRHSNIVNQYVYLRSKRENDPLAINNISEAVRVVAPATDDSATEKMSPWAIFLMSLFLGCFVIPILLIFIAFIIDNHVRDRFDLMGYGIPLIGEVPLLTKVSLRKRMGMKFNQGLKSFSAPRLLSEMDMGDKQDIFIKLRTDVDFRVNKFNGIPTLIFTSFDPGSGKSFIALNTAAAESWKGKRALLVDLDIRRATLSKRVNSPLHGVTSYLNGTSDDIDRLIVHDENADIDIMPCGPMQPNPAELLESPRLDRMFTELRERYDYIFVDCAPLKLITDTQIIARVASHTIVVARAGLMDRRLMKTLQRFNEIKVLPNIHTVLNGVDNKWE